MPRAPSAPGASEGALVDLDGKVALVTGGASGIGLRAARRLAAAGAVPVIADVADSAGEAAAAEVAGRYVHLDVADPRQCDAALEEIRRALGGLHVALLNAGVATGESDITKLTDEQYRRAMGVNVDGVVFGVRATVPAIAEAGGGAIVATASLGGLVPMPLEPIYSAAKHAVVALVRSLAPQLGERDIRINAVCPGYADTPLVTEELRGMIDQLDVPLLDPEVVADAMLQILTGGGTGEAWFCQPGRPCGPYAFRGVPGPR
jgi:NAD(P)-dependent dehydrogenase (short-subunit alcohol dehydrogenase family)